MFEGNLTIDECGKEILRSLVGQYIEKLEAVIVARDNLAWQKVRVYTPNHVIDVAVVLDETIINDLGDTDELSTLHVCTAEQDAFAVTGTDCPVNTCDVGSLVRDVTLVNGRVITEENGVVIADRSYTQAITFALDSGTSLVLDKGPWFSEMIAICKGEVSELVYDDEQNWGDDPEEPDVHYFWSREFVSL